MNDMTGEQDQCESQRGAVTSSSLPVLSPISSDTWIPGESPLPLLWDNSPSKEAGDLRDGQVGMPANDPPTAHFYEELFCTNQTPLPLVSAITTSNGHQTDVVRQGYLGKSERNHRRYFVLRAGSHTGSSRLEWYKTREKFAAAENSSGKTGLYGSSKQGVIYLRCCIGVSRIGNSRKGLSVALYAKEQTITLMVGDHQEQEEWYLSIKKLMEEEWKDEEYGQGVDEEDDGYCTLPPATFFKEVWPLIVKPRGLGRSKSLAGEVRLCLTAISVILVRVGTHKGLPSITIPLLSVRRFGHLDGSFFLELGRSAPHGPGEIWLEGREQGDPALAQHIHEVVRETVKTLRALPDFSHSPTSKKNNAQVTPVSKRTRLKNRDIPAHVRHPDPPQSLSKRNMDTRSDPTQKPLTHTWDKTEPDSISVSPHLSTHSIVPESGSYIETAMDYLENKGRENNGTTLVTGDHCSAEASGIEESWDTHQEEEELGYMKMSPQANHSSTLPQNGYMIMQSHCKCPGNSSSSSLQTDHSPFIDRYYSLLQSHHKIKEQIEPLNSTWPEGQRGQLPAQTAVCSPKENYDGSGPSSQFVPTTPSWNQPAQASAVCETRQSFRPQAVLDQSAVRRHWLSCLPCLQAEDPEYA